MAAAAGLGGLAAGRPGLGQGGPVARLDHGGHDVVRRQVPAPVHRHGAGEQVDVHIGHAGQLAHRLVHVGGAGRAGHAGDGKFFFHGNASFLRKCRVPSRQAVFSECPTAPKDKAAGSRTGSASSVSPEGEFLSERSERNQRIAGGWARMAFGPEGGPRPKRLHPRTPVKGTGASVKVPAQLFGAQGRHLGDPLGGLRPGAAKAVSQCAPMGRLPGHKIRKQMRLPGSNPGTPCGFSLKRPSIERKSPLFPRPGVPLGAKDCRHSVSRRA